jgi:hypothetical protein
VPGASTRVPSAEAADPVCPVPVDISMVFDHSGSMDDTATKLARGLYYAPRESAFGKLESMVAGARIVRAELQSG